MPTGLSDLTDLPLTLQSLASLVKRIQSQSHTGIWNIPHTKVFSTLKNSLQNSSH